MTAHTTPQRGQVWRVSLDPTVGRKRLVAYQGSITPATLAKVDQSLRVVLDL